MQHIMNNVGCVYSGRFRQCLAHAKLCSLTYSNSAASLSKCHCQSATSRGQPVNGPSASHSDSTRAWPCANERPNPCTDVLPEKRGQCARARCSTAGLRREVRDRQTHHVPALVLEGAGDAGPPDGHRPHPAASSLAGLRVALSPLLLLRGREEGGAGPRGDDPQEHRRGQRRQELPQPLDLHRRRPLPQRPIVAGTGGGF